MDGQHYVGSPYISMNPELVNIEGIDLASNESCLVYDSQNDEWKHHFPCVEALGVCRTNLGI